MDSFLNESKNLMINVKILNYTFYIQKNNYYREIENILIS